jgi:hypothetical protein
LDLNNVEFREKNLDWNGPQKAMAQEEMDFKCITPEKKKAAINGLAICEELK